MARARQAALLVVVVGVVLTPGCAAITNPVADSPAVKNVPPDLQQTSIKDKEQTIALSALQQPAPDAYRLDVGDILGVWIEGVIGERELPIPVHAASLLGGKRNLLN